MHTLMKYTIAISVVNAVGVWINTIISLDNYKKK